MQKKEDNKESRATGIPQEKNVFKKATTAKKATTNVPASRKVSKNISSVESAPAKYIIDNCKNVKVILFFN